MDGGYKTGTTLQITLHQKNIEKEKMNCICDKVEQLLNPDVSPPIMDEIRNDTILFQLDLVDPATAVCHSDLEITIRIGPRKFVFDVNGNWQGSGTHICFVE